MFVIYTEIDDGVGLKKKQLLVCRKIIIYICGCVCVPVLVVLNCKNKRKNISSTHILYIKPNARRQGQLNLNILCINQYDFYTAVNYTYISQIKILINQQSLPISHK